MEIILNDKAKKIPEGSSLRHLINDEAGVAVAVNNRVIPKAEQGRFTLSPGDRILVIKATQGG